MIGEHTVKVYGDPAAATWVSLASNPGFDASFTGWIATPYGSQWDWVAGGYVRSRTPNSPYQGIDRSTTSPINRPANVARWRVRCRFSLPSPANAWIGVLAGRTPQDVLECAYGVPQDEDHSYVINWTWGNLPAGTQTLEMTLDAAQIKDLPYVAPHIHFAPTTTAMDVDFLDLSYRSNAGEADLSCLVDEISIQHGRSDTTSQPEASSCTLDLTASTVAPLPAVVDVGAVIAVSTRVVDPTSPDNPIDSMRFTGRVTDVHMGWDEAGEETPDRGVVQVVAVGPLADLGRRVVGAEPFPQELDGARVARVLTLAGVTLDPAFSDPGTVQILPRDIDSRAALEVATDTALSAGGMVWQTKSGEVRYADADHRRGTPAALTLDACDILVTPAWVRNMDGLTNSVSIGYGETPEGSEQPRYIDTRPDSQAKWGVFAYTAATELAALADAQALANLILTRQSRPAWVLSTIPVEVAGLDAAETAALLRLDVHALLNLTGLPAIGAAPTSLPAWVEGWTEHLANGVHDIELVVSDYCRTAPPPRWNDISPATTWDTVGTLTWDDAACLGPPASFGRWDDVSASLRWDQIAPAITWDTWT